MQVCLLLCGGFEIKEEIWIEKYRPFKLDDVVGQTETIERLKSYIKTRNLPHLLFSGPPGVGKTATSVSIARELFGDSWRENFTELNASDERGIDVVRLEKTLKLNSPIIGAARVWSVMTDRVVVDPSEGRTPYGCRITGDGDPFFCVSQVNVLGYSE